jgi:hypothetical protein
MHHYTQMTCGRQPFRSTVSVGPRISNSTLEIDVPQIAFTSDIVLSALLALSALNLSSLNPRDKGLIAASRYYFDKTVVRHRAALGQIDGQNAEPILVTAVLIVHYHWLSIHKIEAQEPFKINTGTYHLCQGFDLVAQKAAPWLSKYRFTSQVDMKPKRDSALYDVSFVESALQDMKTFFKALNDACVDQKVKDVYEKVAEEIITAYYFIARECVDESALEQMLVTILHRVPASFVQLLEDHEPYALALYARSIVLLSVLEDTSAWWIHGAGEDKVCTRQISGICSLLPAELRWTMDWPLRVLSKQIRISRVGIPNAS